MKSIVRIVFIWLVALLVPVQGTAAAYLQYCDLAGHHSDPSKQEGHKTEGKSSRGTAMAEAGKLQPSTAHKDKAPDPVDAKQQAARHHAEHHQGHSHPVNGEFTEDQSNQNKCEERLSFSSSALTERFDFCAFSIPFVVASSPPSAATSFLTGAPERPPRSHLL